MSKSAAGSNRPNEQANSAPELAGECVARLRLWKDEPTGVETSWVLSDCGSAGILVRQTTSRPGESPGTELVSRETRIARGEWDELIYYLHSVVLPPLMAASTQSAPGDSFGIEFEHPNRPFRIEWRDCEPMEWAQSGNWFEHTVQQLNRAFRAGPQAGS